MPVGVISVMSTVGRWKSPVSKTVKRERTNWGRLWRCDSTPNRSLNCIPFFAPSSLSDNSRCYSIPLVVGRRIAQIVFFDSIGTLSDRSYGDTGKYQSGEDIQTLIASWEPSAMLPKMYKDREIRNGPSKEIHAPLTSPSKAKYLTEKEKENASEKNGTI